MKELKQTLPLFLFLLLGTPIFCQVSISIPINPYSEHSLKQFLEPTIINNGTTSPVVNIHYKIIDANSIVLAELVSNTLEIPKGVTKVRQPFLGYLSKNFSSSSIERKIDQEGKLPWGKLTLCIDLILFESNESIAERCVNVEPRFIITLATPRNQAEIKQLTPFFTWFTSNGMESGIKYNLTLKELLPEQSAVQAMQENEEISASTELLSNTFAYPATAVPLEKSKSYVWQVSATYEEQVIAVSDVWQFSITTDSLTKLIPPDNSYVFLSKNMTSAFYNSEGLLKFTFEGQYKNKSLSYNIYNSKMEKLKPLKVSLIQQYGDNLYSIDLTKNRTIKNGDFYTLEVINEKNEKFYLRFMYNNKKF